MLGQGRWKTVVVKGVCAARVKMFTDETRTTTYVEARMPGAETELGDNIRRDLDTKDGH